MRLVIDTREKQPILWVPESVRKCLKYGDYALEGKEGIAAVELKQKWDWVSCLHNRAGRNRLERQLARLVENVRHPLLIVLEPPPEDVIRSKFPGFRRHFAFEEIYRLSRRQFGCDRFLSVFPAKDVIQAGDLTMGWLNFWTA